MTGITVYRNNRSVTPIALRVRELRRVKAWSQAELARRAGIRPATLSDIENGRTKGIDFDTLERLADVLGCDPGYLIIKTFSGELA